MLNAITNTKSTDMARFTIGERVTNLRQLTRMPSLSDVITIPAGEYLTIDPRWFDFSDDTAFCGRDSRISRIYNFQRGGRNFKLVPQAPPGVPQPVFNVFAVFRTVGLPEPPTTSATAPLLTDSVPFSYFVNLNNTAIS